MTAYPLEIWGLTTSEMTRLFSAERIVRAMLDFEKGLALALADEGLIPERSGQVIASACETMVVDAEEVLATTWQVGTPVIRLIEGIRENLDDEDGRWVHHGSTTQDVIDTAHMLLASEALEILVDSLWRVARPLHDLVLAHREQPQMGRTFLQHALPTTFAMRAVGWLEPTLQHLRQLKQVREDLVVQLGGPVGTRSAYGAKAPAVVAALADHLGLGAPAIAWHADRSRVRRLSSSVSGVASTMAKIALDTVLLAQSDVAEVTMRRGFSSSMEGKRNPIDSVRAMAAADVASGAASILERARPHELDRGIGSWQAEWVALPILFQATSACLEATASSLSTLEVDRAVMMKAAGPDSLESIGAIDPGQIDSVLDMYRSWTEG